MPLMKLAALFCCALWLAACGRKLDDFERLKNESDGGADSCLPKSCVESGQTYCGFIADGCQGQKNCGKCETPQICGSGGVPNVCSCTPCKDCACSTSYRLSQILIGKYDVNPRNGKIDQAELDQAANDWQSTYISSQNLNALGEWSIRGCSCAPFSDCVCSDLYGQAPALIEKYDINPRNGKIDEAEASQASKDWDNILITDRELAVLTDWNKKKCSH